ncbi:uncharacterized protein LOC144652511 isoform X2 [Oculina patagonica]
MELIAAWKILCFLVIILTVTYSQEQAVSFLDINIRSKGCNDPGMTPGTCGIAYIRVNGKDYSPHGRGHNVVIVDAKTGTVLGSKSFDTHGVPSAGVNLRDYLNAINGTKIVLVAIQDAGSTYVSPAINALKRLGAKDPILKDFRGSFALVGYAQPSKPSWIAQEQQKRYEGPSEILLRIPLKQSSQPPSLLNVDLRSEGCDDPEKTGGCGVAFIKVNNQDYSLHKRGFNVAVFTEQGLFLESRAFDTHGVLKAGVSLAKYLNRIYGNKIVLVAVQDSAARYGSAAIDALKKLGARDPILAFRSSFALVSFAGSTLPSWVSQVQNKRYQGPTVLQVAIKRVSFLDIHIRSEGCNDTGMTPGTCGIAYIRVNGIDYSLHGRGHNVVTVDATTGAVLGSQRFDTHGDNSSGVKLRDYLDAINGTKIVLVAIQDAGSKYVSPAINALKRLGAMDPILKDFRVSFALVGYAHPSKPSWIVQEQQKRYEGPSEIFLRIPLKQSSQPPSLMNVELRSEGCDDPGKTWCGVAFIKVNNQDYSLHKRGFNVAVFTEQGLFLEARAFDTYGVVKAGTSVANYLNRLHGNKIVLVAVQDSADTYGSAAIGALKRLGAREPIILEFRSSFALAGFTGSSLPSWVSQAQNKRYKGPSVLLVTIEGGCSCFLPLGMESRHLPDSTLSASSSYNANHAPQRSRLNTVPSKGKVGAWCARKNNAKQGLQVKFGRETTVTKVATQGRYDGNHWVMSYSLSYSVDGSHWAWYRLSDGQVKVFGGNVDRNTPVYHLLHPRVQAKYVRFHPRTWYGHICMRAELYGCSVHRCLMSLGLEDGRIQDGAMSASSIWDSDHATKLGRLNLVASSGKAGAWCVKTRDAHQWLQIDLGKGTTVTKVATQGRQDANQWVTSYSISYSPAKSHWVYVMTHGKKTVFAGNFDRNSIVAHEILPPFHAYLVKIHPGSYYGWMSMRVELYGCPIKGIKG